MTTALDCSHALPCNVPSPPFGAGMGIYLLFVYTFPVFIGLPPGANKFLKIFLDNPSYYI